jgi:hypothetical protein
LTVASPPAAVYKGGVTILSARQWEVVFAVGARLVPEVAALDAARRDEFSAIVETALAQRPAGMRRQLRVFLALIENAPLAHFGGRFTRLGPAAQDRVLRALQDAPVELLRKGFWGLKALVLMGYYARPEAAAEVGWTPSFRGNEKLHA